MGRHVRWDHTGRNATVNTQLAITLKRQLACLIQSPPPVQADIDGFVEARRKARYRTTGGRTKSKTVDRKVDAERWRRSELSRRDRGEWVDPALGKVRFDEWTERVMAGRAHLRDSAKARDQAALASLVLPWFGTVALNGIAPDDVRTWVSECTAAGYAPSTVSKAYQLLSIVMAAAVNDGLIVRRLVEE